jgi:hypothetical protein
MQAIRTRFHGPTNTMGSRYSAQAEAGKKTFSADYSLAYQDNHKQAAYDFANSLNWLERGETLEGGQFGNDFYWVIVPKN